MGTDVKLPPTLLFPIEIVDLLVPAPSSISRHDRLLKFKYWNRVPDGVPEDGEEPHLVTKEFYGYFESPHDGQLEKWLVKPGDRVNDNMTPVFVVDEGCSHSVQFGGLCAICGRSLEDKDYMGYSDVDRAPIAMSHDTAGLTVSREEAERIEARSSKQLIAGRRLILVVDLDQTVIHASVSPEVGHWIADEDLPQHEAVKDVRSFSLRERGQQSWYYVKLRPGLSEFLEKMNSKYEMHVYTMATKQYAMEIAKVIDPDGKYFADRILSRDASGSLLHKDLKRLFPVSTQMVTIIDDRGDVWNWSPNLVRVVPYQFWSNTGDINSQFLPKRNGLVTPDSVNDANGDGESDEVTTHDNDHELKNVGKALLKLHDRFYSDYDSNHAEIPDVGKLLPALKSKVFDGCVFLFSGFFPLGTTDLDSADIVQWVRSFGAVVLADFLPSVTHVIARNAGTMKARQAAGQKKLVVSVEWVFACLEKWERVDESPYILHVPNPVSAGSDGKEDANQEDQNNDMDPNIAEGFMRSLQRGDVNWGAMDEELKELLDDDDDDEDDMDLNAEDEVEDGKIDTANGNNADANQINDENNTTNNIPEAGDEASSDQTAENEMLSKKRKRDSDNEGKTHDSVPSDNSEERPINEGPESKKYEEDKGDSFGEGDELDLDEDWD